MTSSFDTLSIHAPELTTEQLDSVDGGVAMAIAMIVAIAYYSWWASTL